MSGPTVMGPDIHQSICLLYALNVLQVCNYLGIFVTNAVFNIEDISNCLIFIDIVGLGRAAPAMFTPER